MIMIIPARGGSKGIHRKNLIKVGGIPLVERAVRAGLSARCVSRVIVSTDDTEIMKLCRKIGAEVLERPEDISGDVIMPDAAVSHVLNNIKNSGSELTDIACFAQPTSPFTSSNDIDSAYRKFCDTKCDSMFSGVLTHSFLWKADINSKYLEGINHDSSLRLGRQQLDPQYRETGALYLFKTSGFLEVNHRFFGNIGVYEVPSHEAIDIDDEFDLELARYFVIKKDER